MPFRWITSAVALVLPAACAGMCTSSVDCGLNGECDVETGLCDCDAGWKSDNCTKLDFQPAGWGPERQAFMTNRSSWGGNAVLGPDGLYHLFFSEMDQEGLHEYQSYSQATHAVSKSLFGPYERREVIKQAMSHNVQPQVGSDGAVYIYMIHRTPYPDAEPHGPLMVGRADTVDGPWEWVLPEMLGLDGAKVAPDFPVDNPSAILYANGSALLMTRNSAMWTAESWRGPYHLFSDDVLGCGCSLCACSVEDPFIWQSPRGLHMLAHDHEPFDFHKQVTAYAFTTDVSGRSGWTFSWWPAATAEAIAFDDGTNHAFCSQQRPQVHFDSVAKDGVQHGRMVAFFTGVQHGALTEKTKECGNNNQNSSEHNPYLDYSFTMAMPFADRKKPTINLI